MIYTLMPSLEHVALVKIVIALWMHQDSRALIADLNLILLSSKRIKKWQEIEDKIVEKVPQLPQPESLKKEILGFIKPIGLQILKWLEYHHEKCCLRNEWPNNPCWTPEGTVDKKKTAEVVIKDEHLDITKRYKLACIYCLEDDIPELWNKMPENSRKIFYSEVGPTEVRQQELVVLWTYILKGEEAKMVNFLQSHYPNECSLYQYAFECAAVSANKAATEYFFQKLIPKEIDESLVRSARYVAVKRCMSISSYQDFPKEDYADVLCFLLSQMNEEQQTEVLKICPCGVLKCLLDWPWQNLFMETANRMWDFLSEKDYDYLLRIIIDKVIDGYKDCNYQKLFGEFWQQSPNSHKRYAINKCDLLSEMFKSIDEKNIKLILKNATLIEKGKLLFCNHLQHICQDLIFDDKWDLLELLIRECISSKDEMIKFKEKFEEHITWRCSEKKFASKKDKRDKFFQLLHDLIRGFDKEKSVEEC